MEFRLLGTLQVVGPNGSLPLGGPKQRMLLAVLLLHANETVSTDRLIDELWSEQPPPTATAYVQNCVHRLRKTLGVQAIETVAPGYVLRVPAEAVDASRFERLLRESRDVSAGDRAVRLREALSLWRGQALADFAFEPFAQAEIARLEETRLGALEDRIEAELELGVHLQLAAEIEALAIRHPSRERLRELQMLGLYRAGRQTDALRVYQDARLALIEELGLEPGERLRALERMILEHDPTLDLQPAEAMQAPPFRDGRRMVTILLAGVVQPDALDPEAARAEFDVIVSSTTAIVEKYGGTVEQLLGEELVAAFGAEQAHEDDALRALRAAVEVRSSLGDGRQVRIGVEAGEMLVGERLTGPPLKTARRLHGTAASGEILLGPGALRLAAGAAEVVSTNTGQYRLLGISEGASAVARRLRQPLVGRRDELARLRAALDEAIEQSTASHVVVVGDAGIGKSRLGAAFVASLGDDVLALRGSCVPYGEGTTYLPLTEAFRDVVGPGDLQAAIERRLTGVEDHALVAACLAAALTRGGGDPVGSSEVSWAARRFLESMARKRPLVLVVEDAHWAEPTLLDLVEHVAEWTAAPMLVLTLARPELLDVRPGWTEAALTLESLAAHEARALVEALPEQGSLASEEISAVLTAAQGNPLYLEQLTAFAAERGFDDRRVPPTIQALLSSRLDRLDAVERLVLERASVIGAAFTRSAVEELISGSERDEVAAALLVLVRRRLVQAERSQPGEDGFGFRHALVRDVAYAGLPKSVRANLHERLARWLDERPGALDEIVGFHLEQAYRYGAEVGDGDRALARQAAARLGNAGIGAVKRADNAAAASLLGRAAALLPESDTHRLELLCELGLAQKTLGSTVDAMHTLEAAAALANAKGDRRIELRAQVEQVWPRMLQRDASAADTLALLREAVTVFGQVGDKRGLARAWQLIAAVRGAFQGQRGESEEAAERALAYYRTTGFAARGCLMLLGAAAYYGPRPASEAIVRFQELLSDPAIDRGSTADLLTMLAGLEGMRGRFDVARAHLANAIGIYAEVQPSAPATDWTHVAANVELNAGDFDRVESLILEACGALSHGGDRAWLATHTATLAGLAYERGEVEEALRLSEAAMDLSPEDDLTAQVLWRIARAKALARRGDPAEGEDLVREALGLLEASDELTAKGTTYFALAEVLEIAGRASEVEPVFIRAEQLFVEKENLVLAESVRRHLAELRS